MYYIPIYGWKITLKKTFSETIANIDLSTLANKYYTTKLFYNDKNTSFKIIK